MRIRTILAGAAVLALLLAAPARAADEQGYVGFWLSPLVILSADQKAELGITGEGGVVVASVTAGGPADRAGMRPGDKLLRFGAENVPDLTADIEEPRHLWHVAARYLLANVRAGVPVEVTVEREGKRMVLKLTPVTEAELHRLQADEALGGRTLPALADAGAPQPLTLGFEGVAEGALLPPGLFPYEGRWRVVAAPDTPANAVLRQDRTVLPWAVLLVAGKGRAFRNGTARVRFMELSGVQDASAGIIFRAQDPKNYYVVRPNSLEDNFRIYIVRDGIRSQLATVKVVPPPKNGWHEFEVSFTGADFRATLDGKDVVEARDETFTDVWCGLCTKADSVTLFDDFQVTPR